MSRHAGTLRAGVFVTVVCVAAGLSSSVIAQGKSPPNFAPGPSATWFANKREFIPPKRGPGPVVQHPKYPRVTNDDYRVTGQQPTFAFADADNPILQPWAREVVRKQNELVASGKAAYSRHASCYPVGVPAFDLMPMTRPMYFVQGKKEVLMLLTSFADVRRIFLDVPHSKDLKRSWHGESVGHYEGDTLVVVTIGMNDKTAVDGFETPHTEQMHVVERFRLVDADTLEVEVYVEDPGAFTTPWTAIERYTRQEGIARRTNVANVAMLASAGEGPLLEAICAENPFSLMGLETIPIAQSKAPDF
jgi:hypothetical protein